MGKFLAGEGLFAAVADSFGKGKHAIAFPFRQGTGVLTVDEEGFGAGVAQGAMQDRAVFCLVDGLPRELGVEGFWGATFSKKLLQKAQGRLAHAVLRVVKEQQILYANMHAFKAVGFCGKEVAQVPIFGFDGMGF